MTASFTSPMPSVMPPAPSRSGGSGLGWGLGGLAVAVVLFFGLSIAVGGIILLTRRSNDAPLAGTPSTDPTDTASQSSPLPLLGGGARPAALDVTGHWSATWGSGADTHGIEVTLVQTVNQVSGSYIGDSRGDVSGTLDGDTLRGRWVEGAAASQQGPVVWKFDAAGRGFSGRYDSDDGAFGGEMHGVRE